MRMHACVCLYACAGAPAHTCVCLYVGVRLRLYGLSVVYMCVPVRVLVHVCVKVWCMCKSVCLGAYARAREPHR